MKKRKKTNRVIFHHSLSPDVGVEEIRTWHVDGNGYDDIGYHFVIRADGLIETGRHEKYIGAHAKGKNGDSIGICLAGDFRKHPPTQSQIDSSRALYYSLCKLKYKKLLKIEFHRTKENPCPGVMLDRTAFKKALTTNSKTGEAIMGRYEVSKSLKKGLVDGIKTGLASEAVLMGIVDSEQIEAHVISVVIGVVSGLARTAWNWWKNKNK